MVSEVWTHFTKVKNLRKARCKKCTKDMAFHGSTTSLANHLFKKHGIVINNVRVQSRSPCDSPPSKRRRCDDDIDNPAPTSSDSESLHSSSSSGNTEDEPNCATPVRVEMHTPVSRQRGPLQSWVSSVRSYEEGGRKRAEVNDALMYMIVKDNMPLSTPEKPGFKKFCKTVNPLYKAPTEKTCTKMIEDKYVHLRGKVGDSLDKAVNIVLTTDLWSETMTNRSFLGVTAHFVEGVKMKSIALGARPIDVRKTKDNLKDALSELCTIWKIDTLNVVGVVTDNGANIVAAVVDLFGACKHVPCFAHAINNVAQDAIGLYKKNIQPQSASASPEAEDSDSEDEDIPDDVVAADSFDLRDIIKKVKKIVSFFRHSEIASTELRNLQMKEWSKKETECLKLIQEVRTRWNSLYNMLDRFLLLSDFVTRSLMKLARDKSCKSKVPDVLTASELNSLSEVRDILKPLYQLTKELCSEKSVTISKCIPLIHMTMKKLDEVVASDVLSFNLKGRVIDEINRRFFASKKLERHYITGIATILDPRFKKVHFTDRLAVTAACTNIKYIMEKYSTGVQETEPQNTLHETNSDSLWRFHDEIVAKQATGQELQYETPGVGFPLELRQYLAAPVCSRQVDPLVEWETLKHQYPTLYKIALEFLPVLATSVPSERLFSRAGMILTKLRNRMSGKHLDQLLFLSHIDETTWFS